MHEPPPGRDLGGGQEQGRAADPSLFRLVEDVSGRLSTYRADASRGVCGTHRDLVRPGDLAEPYLTGTRNELDAPSIEPRCPPIRSAPICAVTSASIRSRSTCSNDISFELVVELAASHTMGPSREGPGPNPRHFTGHIRWPNGSASVTRLWPVTQKARGARRVISRMFHEASLDAVDRSCNDVTGFTA